MEIEGRTAYLLLLCVCLLHSPVVVGASPDDAASVAPFAFADPDGLELTLESLTVRAAINGPLSLTEMELVFRNPRDRLTEGRFSCVLPEDAVISRFAMDVAGQLMEGEVVERLRANRIYEEILNQMRDPALLEQDQGNRFAVRVFPIGPNAPVRLVLSWSRLLRENDGMRTFIVPLRGLARIGSFVFEGHFSRLPGESHHGQLFGDLDDSTISTSRIVRFERSAWVPDRDLSFSWPVERGDSLLRAGDHWVAVLHPEVGLGSRATEARSLVLYVDTSASSADGFTHRIRALTTLLESLGAREVELLAFDHEVAPLLSGHARELAASIGPALTRRGFLGATNLAAMLRDLSGRAKDDPGRVFVVVSDGAATIGGTSPREIADGIAAVPGSVDVHALVLGSRRSEATLRTITEGRGRIVGIPFTSDLDRAARQAASRLLLPRGDTVGISSDGAEFVWPSRADDVRTGDEIIVVGRTRGNRAPVLFVGSPSGRRQRVDVSIETMPDRFAPLLEREAARGYLDLLARRERDETVPALREALIAEQVRVSISSRIQIPRTTMLVLETENDYVRFGVDRSALSRILTIGPGGIEMLDRSRPPAWSGSPSPRSGVIRVGSLTGRVIHEGAPLPGATVVASSPAIPGTRSTVSNVRGEFSFPALPPGQYTLRAQMEGMTPVTLWTTVLPGGTGSLGDLNLQLSAIAESITVTSAAPTVLHTTEVRAGAVADLDDAFSSSSASPQLSQFAGGHSSFAAEAITVTAAAPAATEDITIRTTVTNDGSIRPLPGVATRYAPSVGTIERWLEPSRRSVSALEDAVRKNPLDRHAWSALGEELASRERWARLATFTREWQERDPLNPQVYELIGEAALATGDRLTAERAFGSLVETAAANPELVQRAGMLLFRMGNLELSESALRLAWESRPDRVNAWRHLALVVWRAGRHEEAVAFLEDALGTQFSERQLDVPRVLREELGYVLRDWIRVAPDQRADLTRRASLKGVDLDRRDALRITLAWDTDANDVDLHVIDPSGEEVYFENPVAKSGLELYEDVTRGFGPEVVRTDRLYRGTYQVGVNYYAVGPMGVSRGIVVVIRETASGDADVDVLAFRLRPEREAVIRVADLKM